MFCTNCGANQPDDGLFCTNCGHKLEMPAFEQAAAQDPEEPIAQSAPIAAESVEPVADYEANEAVQGGDSSPGDIEVAQNPETVQGNYTFTTDTPPQEPSAQGSYSASVPPQEPQGAPGTYGYTANAQSQPSQPYEAPQAAPVKKKKFLFDDSEPSDSAPKAPRPPKAKKERAAQGVPAQDYAHTSDQIGFAPQRGNNKTLFLAIIGVLAAALCGIIVWLVITMGEVKSLKADIGTKDGLITEQQAALASLNASKGQDKDTIAALQSTVADLNAEIAKNKDKLAFFNTYAVIIADDGTGYYHSYDCTHYDHKANFWIYNIAAAQDDGFKPCPYCQK